MLVYLRPLCKWQVQASTVLDIQLAVNGMVCEACENTVQTPLMQLRSSAAQALAVIRVPSVSFKNASVTIIARRDSIASTVATARASSTLQGSDKLIEALDAVGFDAHVVSWHQVDAERDTR